MSIHWPETSKFCGIFSHNVGVYVYTVTNVMYNGWILYFIWGLFMRLRRINFDSIYIENNEDSSEIGEVANILYIVLLCIVIAVSVYKVLETLSLAVLLFGVWMKKAAIVKLHMYFSAINWIVGVVISFIISFLIDKPGRLILISLILIHAYMILNIRSLYLKMSGKSRIVVTPLEILDPDALEPNSAQCANNQDAQNTVQHCRTCNCNHSTATSTPNETFAYQTLNSNTSTAENTPVTENRLFDTEIATKGILNNNRPIFLNLSLGSSLYNNQNQSEPCTRDSRQNPDLVDQTENREGVTDDLSKVEDKKVNTQEKQDIPVLYDENQLHIGTSPLFESNPITKTADLRHSNAIKPNTSQNEISVSSN